MMDGVMWSHNSDVERRAESLTGEAKTKFLDIPYYVHEWTKDFGGLKGKRVLDFGCGSGISSAGIAILHEAEQVIGVDINSEATACEIFLNSNFDIPTLPSNLAFEEIRPGQTTSHQQFDCIFSWSVFEHVNNRLYPSVLAELVSKMKPGGLFFVQISPLYFSPEGSHLWAIGYDRWEHLTNQTSDVYEDIFTHSQISSEAKEALWSMFRTLNRVTASQLLNRLADAGLVLIREQRDCINLEPTKDLLSIYSREVLLNYQVVALLRKPDIADK
jgi:cyclopropane fatty-acyl-phospholipid synthase-like methyltransferase